MCVCGKFLEEFMVYAQFGPPMTFIVVVFDHTCSRLGNIIQLLIVDCVFDMCIHLRYSISLSLLT